MALTFDSIGGYPFISLEGDLNPSGMKLEPITRPGVDGVAYRETAQHPDPTELVSFYDALDWDDADGAIANYKAMQGTSQTIVMRGKTYSNYWILDVAKFRRKAVVGAVGGTQRGSVLLWATFMVIDGN
jgi:hypothetical protein